MTALPIESDAGLDEDGSLRVPAEAAARIAALGPGSKLHVSATPEPVKRRFKPTYGVLAHLREQFDLDFDEVSREMAEEWRQAGKI